MMSEKWESLDGRLSGMKAYGRGYSKPGANQCTKRGRRLGPSTLRDAKYREKLKNSVNLLELVLPLSKQIRSRQKLYEDALQFTALLQESVFHLVNHFRVQNRENICNSTIFTPSYIQASFVGLVKELEKEMKNGNQMNPELVNKLSSMASEFFSRLVMRCSYNRQPDRELMSNEVTSVSSNNNSTRTMSDTRKQHVAFTQRDTLIHGRTHIPDYMELHDHTAPCFPKPATITLE